jgi:nitrite reductase/ring-hydroxylating ferredoxin subunit
VDEIAEHAGKTVVVDGTAIALIRHDEKIFAVSNVCRHQGGPIGEGKVRGDCITCPWHGWEYDPATGVSPPPFHEVLETYPVRVSDGVIYVSPAALPSETHSEGVPVQSGGSPGDDEFYVGYETRMPPGISRAIRRVATTLVLAAGVLAIPAGALQEPFGDGVFEFGVRKTFEGVLHCDPVPYLALHPSQEDRPEAYLLVGLGKHGIPDAAADADGARVRFDGSLIYRGGLHMIEMNAMTTFAVVDSTPDTTNEPISLGPARLFGELVDTKCCLGVMKPGSGKVHRACAVVCLTGGVPPGILVRMPSGSDAVVLLGRPDGAPTAVNPEWAGRVVDVPGELHIVDGIPVLSADEVTLAKTPSREEN